MRLIMNKIFLLLFAYFLIGRPCFNQKLVNPISEVTIESVVHKLFSEFSQNLDRSIFKNNDTKFLIDSIILDERKAMENIKSIFNQDLLNSNLTDLNIYPKKDVIAKSISYYFPKASKSYSDDNILKLDLFERNSKLKNEKVMFIN